jgi:transcriptional regulator with XRE-family HTH domain
MGLNELIKLGDNIRKYRLIKGYKQKELAEILNIKRSTYSNYENNRRVPEIDVLEKIAKALDVTIHDLIEMSYENLIKTNSRSVEIWINDKVFSNEEKEAIQMHFSELLLRYKKLINTASNEKIKLQEFKKYYEEYNKKLEKPLSEEEIQEKFWNDNLNKEISEIENWIKTFNKYLSGVYPNNTKIKKNNN